MMEVSGTIIGNCICTTTDNTVMTLGTFYPRSLEYTIDFLTQFLLQKRLEGHFFDRNSGIVLKTYTVRIRITADIYWYIFSHLLYTMGVWDVNWQTVQSSLTITRQILITDTNTARRCKSLVDPESTRPQNKKNGRVWIPKRRPWPQQRSEAVLGARMRASPP